MFEYYDVKSQEWIVETIQEETLEEILLQILKNLEKEEKSDGYLDF